MKKERAYPEAIRKFFTGTTTDEGFENAIGLFEEPDKKQEISNILYDLWEEDLIDKRAPDLTPQDAENILGKIHHRINKERFTAYPPDKRKNNLFSLLTRIAAILFIPTLIAGLTYYFHSVAEYKDVDSWVTITSPLGSKIKTDLPDGTIIWQNAGSTIKYPRNYTRRNRQVILTGEAYFDISYDKLHPFFVDAKDLKIKVTGTRFNVTSYPDEAFSTVVLEEGKVFVSNQADKVMTEISPEQKYTFCSVTGKTAIQKVDVVTYTSWTKGKLIFRNDPLSKVCNSLRRWYNAEIILDDNTGNLLAHPFTLTIETETLPQVLDYLCQAAPIQYKVEYIPKEGDTKLLRPKYIIRSR